MTSVSGLSCGGWSVWQAVKDKNAKRQSALEIKRIKRIFTKKRKNSTILYEAVRKKPEMMTESVQRFEKKL